MTTDLPDLMAFIAVARSGGFREAARVSNSSASSMSEAVRRLEEKLGVRLLNRTTRSVAPTEAGAQLLKRLEPAVAEFESAIDVVNSFRDRPAGNLKLNVPVAASRLVLPQLLPEFLQAYPDIQVEIVADDSFVDILASGCDAGIRYEEHLEQDMVAIPIGPCQQKFAAGASKEYLERHGRPNHPRDLSQHACIRGKFSSGAIPAWEFERDGETIEVEPHGQLTVRVGAAKDLAVEVAIAGGGIVYLFQDWLRPYFDNGSLEPVLEPWWISFSGPFLYYPSRRHMPGPLRAFVDFVQGQSRKERQ
ncbi:MAG TPA: LysR family transcriptional regulator [Steroidobacteraceae bacterium]|nr:LysR family transcriptional regulator [Steroidobacteraceae bacterium]